MHTKSIRQTVTVGANGHIELDAPELEAGTRVEVVVTAAMLSADDSARRLEALRELRRSLALTPQATEAWVREARAIREASSEKRMAQLDAIFGDETPGAQ